MDPPPMEKSRIGPELPLPPPPFPSWLAAAVVEASSPCPSACGSIAMYGTPPSLSATVNAPPRSAGVLVSPLAARSPAKKISPAMTAALTASDCPLGFSPRSRTIEARHTARDQRRSSSA
jgi:hypothetical protein